MHFLKIPADPQAPQFGNVLLNLATINFAVQTQTVDGADCYHLHFTGPYCAQLSPFQMQYFMDYLESGADDSYEEDDSDYDGADDDGDDYGADYGADRWMAEGETDEQILAHLDSIYRK